MSETVISNPNQIKLDWLQKVLSNNGLLAQSLQNFEVEPLRSENSSIVKIKLNYKDDLAAKLPTTLLLKMCGGGNSADFGPSEVYYYTRDYVGFNDAPLVKCYDGAYSAKQQRYHLLLEDLTESHEINWGNLDKPDYALPTAKALAALHSWRWTIKQREPLGDVVMAGAAELDKHFAHIWRGYQPLLDEIKAETDPEWSNIIKKILTDTLPYFWNALTTHAVLL